MHRFWPVFVILVPLMLAFLLTRTTGKKKHRFGRCRQCGYRLIGVVNTRPRCPECGTHVPPDYLAAIHRSTQARRRLRRRQKDAGTCQKCGYIRRGLTEPRCPKCGEKV